MMLHASVKANCRFCKSDLALANSESCWFGSSELLLEIDIVVISFCIGLKRCLLIDCHGLRLARLFWITPLVAMECILFRIGFANFKSKLIRLAFPFTLCKGSYIGPKYPLYKRTHEDRETRAAHGVLPLCCSAIARPSLHMWRLAWWWCGSIYQNHVYLLSN